VPLSDRDYMQPSHQRRSRSWDTGFFNSFMTNPILVIIAINLVIFIATVINRNLVVTLGLSPLLFTDRPWTILTNMFVHAEFWHFFGNMLVLFFFGRVVYKMMGGWRFLAIYFASGIAGNLLYIWLGNPLSIAIGASGAVYGLAGTLVVLMPNMRVAVWGIIPMPLWVMVLIFFVAWSFFPGVAWQAHMGGLAVGLIAGFLFRRQMRYIIYR